MLKPRARQYLTNRLTSGVVFASAFAVAVAVAVAVAFAFAFAFAFAVAVAVAFAVARPPSALHKNTSSRPKQQTASSSVA
jgi:hypothetical protein